MIEALASPALPGYVAVRVYWPGNKGSEPALGKTCHNSDWRHHVDDNAYMRMLLYLVTYGTPRLAHRVP